MKSLFISSTFRDMNFERDVLNRRIAPKINHKLEKYNQSIRVLDLRWGVDTSKLSENEASKQVLSVCFNSIEECKPYFIVLLGDRYGYIPEDSDVSVTHMEILRGVFDNMERDHIYIYFRDADYSGMPEELKNVYIEQDDECKKKLASLKNELRSQYADRCKSYSAIWSAEDNAMVSESFESMIVADLEADLITRNKSVCYRSDLHKQMSENEEILLDSIRYTYADPDRINADIHAILMAEKPYGIIGGGGTGKSIYASLLCRALRNRGYKADILLCGENVFSSSVRNAAESVLFALSYGEQEEYDYEKNSSLSYDELIDLIIRKREEVKEKRFLILDAVDKCDQGMVNFVSWCGGFLSKQLGIVFTSRMNEEIKRRHASFSLSELKYTTADYEAMVRCILERYGKSISYAHIKMICEKVCTSLQLHLLLLRLVNLNSTDFEAIARDGGGIEAINAYLKKVIAESPNTAEELVAHYLIDLIKETKNNAFILQLLKLLTFCESGFQEDDLRVLVEMSSIRWVEIGFLDFFERFGFFIRVRDNGRIDISHDIIRQTLVYLFKKDEKEICSLIAKYMAERKSQDAVSIRSFMDAVFKSEEHELFLKCMLDWQKQRASKDKIVTPLMAEVMKNLQRLFLQDEGRFIFKALRYCSSPDDIAYYQSLIASSFLSVNDYYPESVILKFAYASIAIPGEVELFKGNLFELEKHACLRFLHRHNISKDKIDEFLEYCDKCRTCATQMKAGMNKENCTEDSFGSVDEMIEKLQNDALLTETDYIMLRVLIAGTAREMAMEEGTARKAQEIANKLIEIEEKKPFEFEELLNAIYFADIYTILSNAGKTLQEWEEGLQYCLMSLEIYQRIYELHPTREMFKKYRERVYNIANMTEAWALVEKNNSALWKKTKERYEAAYTLELTAVSQGTDEHDAVYCAETIISLGTSLVYLGQADEGMKKYREGFSMLKNAVSNTEAPELYESIINTLLSSVYFLLDGGFYQEAYSLSAEIAPNIEFVIESGKEESIKTVYELCVAFSNNVISLITQLHEQEQTEAELLASRILYSLYKAVIPIADHAFRVNTITMKCNVCAILYWKMQDYEQAYEEYLEILHLTKAHDLAAPDKNGRYADQTNGRLADALVRALLCLEMIGRQEEQKQLIAEAEEWAEYIADHMEAIKSDTPFVLYLMANEFSKNGSPLGMLFLMMAFNAMSKNGYDRKAHANTVMMILKALQHGDGTNEDGSTEA